MKLGAYLAYQWQKLANNSWIFDADPELWHHRAMNISNILENSKVIKYLLDQTFKSEHPSLEREFWGVTYKNPIWFAAGFLKDADGLQFREQFGFGYLVIGGITGESQPGKQKPRLFRRPDQLALINRFGLNNMGADAMAEKLHQRKIANKLPHIPIWINIANGKDTPEDQKPAEIAKEIEKLFPYADAFEIDISCPNQEWVTSTQTLKTIISAAQKENERQTLLRGRDKKPIVIKIGPLTSFSEGGEDMTREQLEQIVNICITLKVDGITATNSTKEHSGIPVEKNEEGGMSGKPLFQKSLFTVKELHRLLSGQNIKVIGVGGIGCEDTPKKIGQTAIDMLDAGADALQILSWFIMGGTVASPYIIKEAIIKYKKNCRDVLYTSINNQKHVH